MSSVIILTLVSLLIGSFEVTSFEEPLFPERRPVLPLPKLRKAPGDYRLSAGTTPSHYDLELVVDPDHHESFSGKVVITVRADLMLREIVLHSNKRTITLDRIQVIPDTETALDIYDSHTDTLDDNNFLRINLKEELVVGSIYKISIEYTGRYGINLDGLYLSSYINGSGIRRYLATTQFQAVSARSAFPCYDEPGLKAVFKLKIYTPPGYHAISNTDLVTKNTKQVKKTSLFVADDFLLHEFEPSPLMSTYLVAFVISDYDYKSNLEVKPQLFSKKFRIFAKPSSGESMDYALEFGQKNMNVLQNYTDVEYRLSKLDNIAIPDFSAGAMENWGLITYREPYLLYEKGVTTTRQKEFIGIIMSHENGHMWFGNEVSPAWWNHLWLSEGFATYFEYYATEKVAPEWRMMDQYAAGVVQYAMVSDSLETTNAMTSSVSSPEEIDNNFNRVAYEKAGSVIRMMEHALGSDVFQQGLRKYLKSSSLGIGTPELLFKNLQDALEDDRVLPEGIGVAEIFGSWSNQAGFPIVVATKSVGDRSIVLQQERYYRDRMVSNSGEKWWIPITLATSKNANFENTTVQQWYGPEQTRIAIRTDLTNNSWYIINKQEIGYYRVMYDDNNWMLLSQALKSSDFSNIHLLNRAQLIDDTLEFSRTLRLSYNVTFDLLFYLKEEIDYIPWLTVYPGINWLNTMMPAAENHFFYREFVHQIVKNVYEDVGFEPKENDDPVTRMKRNLVMTIACNVGNQDCRTKSNEKLNNIMQDYSLSLDPDVKSIVYCTGLRNSTDELWNFFWDKYMTVTSNTEKITILRNLACSENENIVTNYLLKTVQEDSGLAEEHRYLVIDAVINSGYIGVDNAVTFVTNNFTVIKNIMPQSTTRIINALRSKIVTQKNIKQFRDFASRYDGFTPSEESTIKNALQVISANEAWLEDVLYDIDPWLIDNVFFSAADTQIISLFLLLITLSVALRCILI